MENQRYYQTKDEWECEERSLDRQSVRFELLLDRDELEGELK